MSNTVYDGVDHTVTRGDIEVTRHLESDGRGIVGTVELRSRATEPLLVEVTQPLPAELSVESMAFKPDAAPEFKNFSGDRITFRQSVEDEPVQVVFGIMATEQVERLAFAPPSIEAADPVGATRSATAGDEDDDEDSDSQQGPDLDIDEDLGADTQADSAGADDADDPTVSGSSRDQATHTKITDGDPGRAATPGAADRRSVDLRLDRLSARVEEFATYTGALESFIDEKGTAPEFVDRVESRVDDIDDRVTATREDLDDEVAAVRAETSAETDDLREDLEATRSEVTALRDDLDALRDDVTALRDEVTTLSEEVDTLTGMRETLATELSNGPLAEPGPMVGADSADDEQPEKTVSDDEA